MFGLKNLFTSDTVDKAVDGVIDGVDKIFYTDEEKAEARQKAFNSKLEALKLFEPFKLAQRYIAIIHTINFVIAFWVGVLILNFGTMEMFNSYINFCVDFSIGWIMLAIIAWYFTGGVIESNNRGKTK